MTDKQDISKREAQRACRSADSQLYNARTLLERLDGYEAKQAIDATKEAQKAIGNAIYWAGEVGEEDEHDE